MVMTDNCTPQTFKAGLKALWSKISGIEFKQVMRFLGMVSIMMVVIAMFFSCLHALITLMGLGRIYLLSLPIDTSKATFWTWSADGVRDHVFWAGYDVFLWFLLIVFVGMLVYVGCSSICNMGRPEAKDDVAAPEVSG